MSDKCYISVDADEIGKKIEKYILVGDNDGLNKFSKALTNAVQKIEAYFKEKGCYIIMSGGDNVLAEASREVVDDLVRCVRDVERPENTRFSVGIGSNTTNAYVALKYAKANAVYAVSYSGDEFHIIMK